MNSLISIAVFLVCALFISEVSIQLKPHFVVSMPFWRLGLGTLLIFIGCLLVKNDIYTKGFNQAIDQVMELLKPFC